MKHLLTGVAIAAALAIAAPAFAQPAPAPAAPKQMKKKSMTHHARAHKMHGGKMMSQGDATTAQLNREELARIQGGGAPMMAPGPMPNSATLPPQGPRPSGAH
jgi:hypothetical protein